MRKGKYFYVVFSDQSEYIAALLAAQAPQFRINGGSARVSKRPLIGETAFSLQRPVYVLDVTAVSCVCSRCQGHVLMFKGLLNFQFWEEVCPEMHELQL